MLGFTIMHHRSERRLAEIVSKEFREEGLRYLLFRDHHQRPPSGLRMHTIRNLPCLITGVVIYTHVRLRCWRLTADRSIGPCTRRRMVATGYIIPDISIDNRYAFGQDDDIDIRVNKFFTNRTKSPNLTEPNQEKPNCGLAVGFKNFENQTISYCMVFGFRTFKP